MGTRLVFIIILILIHIIVILNILDNINSTKIKTQVCKQTVSQRWSTGLSATRMSSTGFHQIQDNVEDMNRSQLTMMTINNENDKTCFSESGYGSSVQPGSGRQVQSSGDRRSRLRKSHSSGGNDDCFMFPSSHWSFLEGLLRSPQTGPPSQPPAEGGDQHQRLRQAPLKTFDDASLPSESFEHRDPHHWGSSSKSSFEDSSLPSLVPSRSHTSNCAKVGIIWFCHRTTLRSSQSPKPFPTQYTSVQCGTVAHYTKGQPSQEKRQVHWCSDRWQWWEDFEICSNKGHGRRKRPNKCNAMKKK